MQGGVQKVKCKGKVQKGKCRRVSAERQVQTGNPHRDLNTLGGSDHVRIHGLPPFPPTSGFVSMFYCVCVFGFMRLWVGGVVSLWVCGLVLCGFVCVCVCSHVCACWGAVCFCVIMCDCMFVDLWVCS